MTAAAQRPTISYGQAFAVKAEISTMPAEVVRRQEYDAMHPLVRAYHAGMQAIIEAHKGSDIAAKVQAGTFLAHRVIRHNQDFGLSRATLGELRRCTGRLSVATLFNEPDVKIMRTYVAADYAESPAVLSLVGSLTHEETKIGALFMFGIYGAKPILSNQPIHAVARPRPAVAITGRA